MSSRIYFNTKTHFFICFIQFIDPWTVRQKQRSLGAITKESHDSSYTRKSTAGQFQYNAGALLQSKQTKGYRGFSGVRSSTDGLD
jgi:hypothetical protein